MIFVRLVPCGYLVLVCLLGWLCCFSVLHLWIWNLLCLQIESLDSSVFPSSGLKELPFSEGRASLLWFPDFPTKVEPGASFTQSLFRSKQTPTFSPKRDDNIPWDTVSDKCVLFEMTNQLFRTHVSMSPFTPCHALLPFASWESPPFRVPGLIQTLIYSWYNFPIKMPRLGTDSSKYHQSISISGIYHRWWLRSGQCWHQLQAVPLLPAHELRSFLLMLTLKLCVENVTSILYTITTYGERSSITAKTC